MRPDPHASRRGPWCPCDRAHGRAHHRRTGGRATADEGPRPSYALSPISTKSAASACPTSRPDGGTVDGELYILPGCQRGRDRAWRQPKDRRPEHGGYARWPGRQAGERRDQPTWLDPGQRLARVRWPNPATKRIELKAARHDEGRRSRSVRLRLLPGGRDHPRWARRVATRALLSGLLVLDATPSRSATAGAPEKVQALVERATPRISRPSVEIRVLPTSRPDGQLHRRRSLRLLQLRRRRVAAHGGNQSWLASTSPQFTRSEGTPTTMGIVHVGLTQGRGWFGISGQIRRQAASSARGHVRPADRRPDGLHQRLYFSPIRHDPGDGFAFADQDACGPARRRRRPAWLPQLAAAFSSTFFL